MKVTFAEAFQSMLENGTGMRHSGLDWNGIYIYIEDGQICKATFEGDCILSVEKNLRLCQILKEDRLGGYDANKVLLEKEWWILNISEMKHKENE